MSSFSRRRYAVTAFSQVFERLPDATGAPQPADAENSAGEAPMGAAPEANPAEVDASTAADHRVVPTGAHGLVEDVDFDTAIAEVLMTLAADRGALGDFAPVETPELPAAVFATFDDHEEAGSDDDDDTSRQDAGSYRAALDPEAILAAEAATFRLLGELDRLWHRAA